MHLIGWILIAVLLLMLAPILVEVLIALLGGIFVILGGLIEILIGMLGVVCIGFGCLIGFVFQCCHGMFSVLARLLVSPFLGLIWLCDLLERKWRGLGRQTIAAMGGVLVLAIIVLLAYLSR